MWTNQIRTPIQSRSLGSCISRDIITKPSGWSTAQRRDDDTKRLCQGIPHPAETLQSQSSSYGHNCRSSIDQPSFPGLLDPTILRQGQSPDSANSRTLPTPVAKETSRARAAARHVCSNALINTTLKGREIRRKVSRTKRRRYKFARDEPKWVSALGSVGGRCKLKDCKAIAGSLQREEYACTKADGRCLCKVATWNGSRDRRMATQLAGPETA